MCWVRQVEQHDAAHFHDAIDRAFDGLDEGGAGTIGREAIRTVVCTSQDDAEVCELWVDQAIQVRGPVHRVPLLSILCCPASLLRSKQRRSPCSCSLAGGLA